MEATNAAVKKQPGETGQQSLSGTLVDAETGELPAPLPTLHQATGSFDAAGVLFLVVGVLAAVFGYHAGRDRFVG